MVTEVKGPSASVVSIDAQRGVGAVPSGTAGNKAGGATARSEVSITGDAATLAALERAVAATPEVDVQRVEAVQKSLADGSYQLDPRKTAENFLRLENLISAATTSEPVSAREP
jgi:flagellar biosynthesis anti-sigma factor FlgM